MKLLSLKTRRYRCLREVTIPLLDLNVFIGANGSGKSTILDALRFLREGVQTRDFKEAVHSRGGILQLAWKGEDAGEVELSIRVSDGPREFEWSVRLTPTGNEFSVREEVLGHDPGAAPATKLLVSDQGVGWWRSGQQQVRLKQNSVACALSSAAADAEFPARGLAEFVGEWGFFDPAPFSLRRSSPHTEFERLDASGQNLAERMYDLNWVNSDFFNQIVSATQSVLGLPTKIEPRESEGRFYFVQEEPGLQHPVHQVGVSSGTLRMLALMTALFESRDSSLVGIEEPENHIHPTALAAFADYLQKARKRVQILVTTHSPHLLNFLDDPNAVCVVHRDNDEGTQVLHEEYPEQIREALEASGFGLGEFYETTGFGG